MTVWWPLMITILMLRQFTTYMLKHTAILWSGIKWWFISITFFPRQTPPPWYAVLCWFDCKIYSAVHIKSWFMPSCLSPPMCSTTQDRHQRNMTYHIFRSKLHFLPHPLTGMQTGTISLYIQYLSLCGSQQQHHFIIGEWVALCFFGGEDALSSNRAQ